MSGSSLQSLRLTSARILRHFLASRFPFALCLIWLGIVQPLRGQTNTLSEAAANSRPLAAATGAALVRSAMDLERASHLDEARAEYLRAIPTAPSIADWIRLRVAGLTTDSVERQELYHLIHSAPAQEQVGRVEIGARERFGDIPGAIRLASKAGLTIETYRLRLAGAKDSASRAAIRKEILALNPGEQAAFVGPEAQGLLEQTVPRPTAAEALILAKFALAGGDPRRANASYAQAFAGGEGTPADRLEYGRSLFRSARYDDAVTQLARIGAASPLASQAVLLRGWAQLRAGDIAAARKTLESLGRRYPHDSQSVGTSLFLLADIAREAGHYAEARRLWLRLGERFPTNARASRARMLAALVLWTERRPREAALEWEAAIARAGKSEERAAPAYWAGRAWDAVGDTARARRRWLEAVASDPLSWYARASERRLGSAAWAPSEAPDSFEVHPAIDSTRERIALLGQAGMNDEARLEATGLASGKDRPSGYLLAAASALRASGWPSFAIQLGWRAVKGGAPRDGRTFRLVFPALYSESLSAEARRRQVDPALIAGLIRQESMFDARALSRAGARGLMQLMPGVARPAAKAAGIDSWNDDLLDDPSVNLKLGVAHLAGLLKDYDDLPRVLAAYNAGSRRADQWSRYPGAKDPEVFTEWVPFDETRGYILAIQRNRELYRALYNWRG